VSLAPAARQELQGLGLPDAQYRTRLEWGNRPPTGVIRHLLANR
jgi:hypothetical protein